MAATTEDTNVDVGDSTQEGAVDDDEEASKPCITWKGVLQLACYVIVAGLVVWLAIAGHLQTLMNWIKNLPFYFSVPIIFVLQVFINMPFGYGYSVIAVSVGATYGWWGFLLVTSTGNPAAWIAYHVDKWQVGDTEVILRKFPKGKIQRLARAIAFALHGSTLWQSFIITFATRPSPLITGLQNLLLAGVGRVPFWTVYVPATFMGKLVDDAILIYTGTLIQTVAGDADPLGEGGQLVVIIIQFVAVLLLMTIVSLSVRHILNTQLREEPEELKEEDRLPQDNVIELSEPTKTPQLTDKQLEESETTEASGKDLHVEQEGETSESEKSKNSRVHEHTNMRAETSEGERDVESEEEVIEVETER